MFLEPFLLGGPLRIILIFVLLLILYRVVTRKVPAQTALNFLIPSLSLILSCVVVGGFFLILIGLFDLFVLLSVIYAIIILIFMNINFKKPLKGQLQKIYTRSILYTVIKIEKREQFIDRDNWKKPTFKNDPKDLTNFHRNWQVLIGISLPIITYLSRASLFQFDTFTLSQAWFKKLSLVRDISLENWFFNPGEMMGDYFLIHLYAQITNISDAVALQSFGLLESSFLAIIIYWFVYKITRRHATGIFSGLSFALLYAFLPLSIDLLAEHKSAFSALIIALPAMLYSMYPQTFRFKYRTTGIFLIILFLAILLIDIFVGLLVLLPFLIIISIFRFWQSKKRVLLVLSSYLIALAILCSFYIGVAWWFDESLLGFINANLFSFDAYTYNPKLILPLDDLVKVYLIIGVIFLAITIFKFQKRTKKYQTSLIFLIFINFLFTIHQFTATLVDIDILNVVLSVFIPIFFGLILNIIFNLLSSIKVQGRRALNIEVWSGVLVILALFIFTFPSEAKLSLDRHNMESHVFRIYSKIQGDHLPYSYAVINTPQNSSFSKDSHYFYSYDYFNNKYIARDRSFQRYKENKSYLLAHPNLFLPEALFVFVYKNEADNFSKNKINKLQQEGVKKRLNLLRAKGREINTYYDSEFFSVYQVINKAKSSNIQELLF